MGQNFSSEPVVEKETERDHNETFNVAVSSCQGWRMSQEDNHSMILNMPGSHKAAFFAVYDGHGSSRVSKHASENLWRHILDNEKYSKGNFKEALEEAFLAFDREVNESFNAQLAGTTAVCFLVVNNTIYCANIGDSRAVACVNCECVPLSYDHKPENPQELKRILAAGGYVLGNRVNGNLALSRAFGDFHYKGNEQLPAEQQIVSPFPDVKTIELNDDLDFLVLACDGIWDVLSSEEVVEFVISRLEQSMEPGLICEQLTTRCLATDYELVIGCDNMTVLLICYTRGRSWVDFCTDIFNKHTRRLGGIPRTRPTSVDETPTTVNNVESVERTGPISNIASPYQSVSDSLRGPEDMCPTKEEENLEEQEITNITKSLMGITSVTDTCSSEEQEKTQTEEVIGGDKSELSIKDASDSTCKVLSGKPVSISNLVEGDIQDETATSTEDKDQTCGKQYDVQGFERTAGAKEEEEEEEGGEPKREGEEKVESEEIKDPIVDDGLTSPCKYENLTDEARDLIEPDECQLNTNDQSPNETLDNSNPLAEPEDEQQQPDTASTTSEVDVDS